MMKFSNKLNTRLNKTMNFNTQGSPKKTVFKDIGIKGGWVVVSKPNFFFIRNYDIYPRWVGGCQTQMS